MHLFCVGFRCLGFGVRGRGRRSACGEEERHEGGSWFFLRLSGPLIMPSKRGTEGAVWGGGEGTNDAMLISSAALHPVTAENAVEGKPLPLQTSQVAAPCKRKKTYHWKPLP